MRAWLRRDGTKERMKPLLLWLWKTLPLPERARRAYLELTHPRFLIGVMALVQDEQGRVLTLEHTYRVRHTWGLPGGYLKRRENPQQGLQREVREETGLEIEVVDLLASGLYSSWQLDLLFRCRVIGGEFRPSSEVRAQRYAAPGELGHILPNQLRMLRISGILS